MIIQPCVLQITRRRIDNAIVPELSGRYLVHYDPRRDLDNCYYMSVTDDRSEAKVFSNKDEAMKYYLQICETPNYYRSFDHISQPLAEEYRIEIVFLPMANS
jgi:hypothetical protein